MITKRVCLALQRKDRELVLFGHETGYVRRTPQGAYYEVHEPLDEYERWELVSQHVYRPLEIDPPTDSNGVARPGYKKDLRRQKLSRLDRKSTRLNSSHVASSYSVCC